MELIPGLPNEIASKCLIRVPWKKFSTIVTVSRCWKKEIESLEFQQLRKASCFTRTVVVLIQAKPAAYRITLYEPDVGVWTELPPVPGFTNRFPLFCQCIGVAGKLVLIGGYLAKNEVSKAVYVYDFMSALWRCGACMPGVTRLHFACASDSDRMVFVAGGIDEEKILLRSAMAYNVAKDKWILLPDMARPRYRCGGIFHCGKFHVYDGICMEERFEKCVEAFDIPSWQWGQGLSDIATWHGTRLTSDDGFMYDIELKVREELDEDAKSKMEVLVENEDANWKVIARVPANALEAPCLLTWQENLLVIRSAIRFTRPYDTGPQNAYILDKKHFRWTKVEMPKELSGLVIVGRCCLVI